MIHGKGTAYRTDKHSLDYCAWLQPTPLSITTYRDQIPSWVKTITVDQVDPGDSRDQGDPVNSPEGVLGTAMNEWARAVREAFDIDVRVADRLEEYESGIILGVIGRSKQLDALLDSELAESVQGDGYVLQPISSGSHLTVLVAGKTEVSCLYAIFHLIRMIRIRASLRQSIVESPQNPLRMVNHWDNADGTIERGYAGKSIFYRNGEIQFDPARIRDYARLLSSVGINAISINNVNVHEIETKFVTAEYLPAVAKLADIFRDYGIRLFLSVNFAAPIELGKLSTADPLDNHVQVWWDETAERIYRHIPDFGGFLVKADSEFRPGPFTYGRNHADGANMLARSLKPFGGLVIWRCFVYNCLQDWRDRQTDRARAAYDHFVPHDGMFESNVFLQVKNGPMDFQVREPVSPLFGGMQETNQMLEVQITQEYTGQQKHLCYLVPQWKEVLDFDTHALGIGSTVAKIASGSLFGREYGGMVGVVNVGDDDNWTGHSLAQANLYGFGRLAWNPQLSAETVTDEWVRLTYGTDHRVVSTISEMLLSSWQTYENYTAPLGVGWMVNPGHHYGPNVDGYEYSKWGTYHFADNKGIGVDRTEEWGTGYVGQYHSPNRERYERLSDCPDELLLFFHHVSYEYVLKSGKTVIQHIYDTHFSGVEQVRGMQQKWRTLADLVDAQRYQRVLDRFERQIEDAIEWRDVINTYFYRKSGINDERGRRIY